MRLPILLTLLPTWLLGAPMALAETYRDRTVAIAVQADLDLTRYLGKWYEIARFPNRFERGCTGVTAEYAMRDDSTISVRNTCFQDGLSGARKVANGTARVEAPGRLSVTFVPWLPFARGDYWVLHVEPDYSMAVVGTPKGSTGWILARTAQISSAKRDRANAVLTKNGYNINQLEDVVQKTDEDN